LDLVEWNVVGVDWEREECDDDVCEKDEEFLDQPVGNGNEEGNGHEKEVEKGKVQRKSGCWKRKAMVIHYESALEEFVFWEEFWEVEVEEYEDLALFQKSV
jgi:hypothetical protein